MNRRQFLKSVLAGLFTLLVPQVQVEAEEVVGPSLIQQAAPEIWKQFKTEEWVERVTSERILCIDKATDEHDYTVAALFRKDSDGTMTLENSYISRNDTDVAKFLSSLRCESRIIVSGQCARHGGKL